jgi:hypothetical protein
MTKAKPTLANSSKAKTMPKLSGRAVICAIETAIPLALCALGAEYLFVSSGAGENRTVGPFASRDWMRFVGGGACLGAVTGLIVGTPVVLIVAVLHNAVRRGREHTTRAPRGCRRPAINWPGTPA